LAGNRVRQPEEAFAEPNLLMGKRRRIIENWRQIQLVFREKSGSATRHLSKGLPNPIDIDFEPKKKKKIKDKL